MDVYNDLITDVFGMIFPFVGIMGAQYTLAMLATALS